MQHGLEDNDNVHKGQFNTWA